MHNIGYGYAAGFLQLNSLPVPSGALYGNPEGEDDANGMNSGMESLDVNTITGQARDMEPNIDIPEMTDEEKEREAERLFVLFERSVLASFRLSSLTLSRLRATGVINIENPVAQAMREGRFEELD